MKHDNIIVVVIAGASYRRPGQDHTRRKEATSLAIAQSRSCRAHTLNIIMRITYECDPYEMEMLRAIGDGYLIFQTGDGPYAALA
jgi:cytosine/adenosine deaminase-related metal-dependent hydrolase